MPNALVLTAPQKITNPLPNTPKLWIAGDRRVVTSDTFTGANVTTLAGRTTDAKLGGTSEAWSASVPAAWGIASGRLVLGASQADSFAALSRPAGVVEVSARVHSNVGSSFWLIAARDALSGPTNQVRAAVMNGEVQINYTLAGEGTANMGAKHPVAAGAEVRIKLDGKEVTLSVGGVVKESLTLPAECPGAFSGIARAGAVTELSVDDFALTETVK